MPDLSIYAANVEINNKFMVDMLPKMQVPDTSYTYQKGSVNARIVNAAHNGTASFTQLKQEKGTRQQGAIQKSALEEVISREDADRLAGKGMLDRELEGITKNLVTNIKMGIEQRFYTDVQAIVSGGRATDSEGTGFGWDISSLDKIGKCIKKISDAMLAMTYGDGTHAGCGARVSIVWGKPEIMALMNIVRAAWGDPGQRPTLYGMLNTDQQRAADTLFNAVTFETTAIYDDSEEGTTTPDLKSIWSNDTLYMGHFKPEPTSLMRQVTGGWLAEFPFGDSSGGDSPAWDVRIVDDPKGYKFKKVLAEYRGDYEIVNEECFWGLTGLLSA